MDAKDIVDKNNVKEGSMAYRLFYYLLDNGFTPAKNATEIDHPVDSKIIGIIYNPQPEKNLFKRFFELLIANKRPYIGKIYINDNGTLIITVFGMVYFDILKEFAKNASDYLETTVKISLLSNELLFENYSRNICMI